MFKIGIEIEKTISISALQINLAKSVNNFPLGANYTISPAPHILTDLIFALHLMRSIRIWSVFFRHIFTTTQKCFGIA